MRDVDVGLAKALSHPLRQRLFAAYRRRTANPAQVAAELGAKLGDVSYHTRRLLELGVIELVDTRHGRGGTAHYYRATQAPVLDGDRWNDLPLSQRRELASGLVSEIAAAAQAAAQRGGFDDGDCHLSRTVVRLDAAAFKELGAGLEALVERALALEARNVDHRDQGLQATELALVLFPSAAARDPGATGR